MNNKLDGYFGCGVSKGQFPVGLFNKIAILMDANNMGLGFAGMRAWIIISIICLDVVYVCKIQFPVDLINDENTKAPRYQ